MKNLMFFIMATLRISLIFGAVASAAVWLWLGAWHLHPVLGAFVAIWYMGMCLGVLACHSQ